MLSIVIIGTGNISHHLLEAFSNSTVETIQVFGRNAAALSKFEGRAKTTQRLDELFDADIYVIAVKDDAIKEISGHLVHKNALVVHTSGSVSIDELEPKRKGVFYPLQTFSRDSPVNFSSVPICIEANSDSDLKMLTALARQVSDSVHEISTTQRKRLHLAAVFANNFSNHLYEIAKELCEDENLSFEVLKPLIAETANKIRILDPDRAQTGPAIRNDVLTMQRHLAELENPIHRKIYQLFSESILRTHEEKL